MGLSYFNFSQILQHQKKKEKLIKIKLKLLLRISLHYSVSVFKSLQKYRNNLWINTLGYFLWVRNRVYIYR